jgi:hypothetical protein
MSAPEMMLRRYTWQPLLQLGLVLCMNSAVNCMLDANVCVNSGLHDAVCTHTESLLRSCYVSVALVQKQRHTAELTDCGCCCCCCCACTTAAIDTALLLLCRYAISKLSDYSHTTKSFCIACVLHTLHLSCAQTCYRLLRRGPMLILL